MKIIEEEVIDVHHWTDQLFSLRTTRNHPFSFANGQFVMMGLPVDGKPLLRAYSIASPNYEEHLDFYSIKVPNGPLTSRLCHIKPGDKVLLSNRPTGTLTIGNLKPGKVLWLLSTGTGLAAFLGVIKDPETYERFEKVVLVHTCRFAADLAYRDHIQNELPKHEDLGEMISEQLIYVPTVTRESFDQEGRVTDLIASGKLFEMVNLPPLDAASDRVMLCGSVPMIKETAELLEARGFKQGNSGEPGDYLTERAFAMT